MEVLTPQEVEISELKLAWKKTAYNEDIITQRINAQIQVFSKLVPLHFSYASKFPLLITSAITPFTERGVSGQSVIPGFPGSRELHHQRLSEFLTESATLIQNVGLYLQDQYIPFLQKETERKKEDL